MATWRTLGVLVLAVMGFVFPLHAAQEQAGSIRGVVFDKERGVPLGGVEVSNLSTKQRETTSEQGTFLFGSVPPGTYRLVFAKQGYVKQVSQPIVVVAGQLADVDVQLAGDFFEMDEFVVRNDLDLGAGSEAALLELRFDSPSLLDSIGSDLMSRAGASDAASALRLVSGASVQDGKFAVIRGLPDRYVSSQLNGVRLPTSDEDKRAVELDQFPSAVIETIQVSKTFTPNQQGDASGGAVDVRLKRVPDEAIFEFKAQIGVNSNVAGSDFISYKGGGVDVWGNKGGLGAQKSGTDWDGAVGTTRVGAPDEFKWSATLGGKQEFESGIAVGGLLSFFYERDVSFSDDGKDDSLWVENPGDPLTPENIQGSSSSGDFKTALFDLVRGSETVQWGGLAALGVETEEDSVGVAYLYTRTAEDSVTLAEDTRGKEYYFPGYTPDDPAGPGNGKDDVKSAPYIRTETIEYTERTASSLQFNGSHDVPIGEFTWNYAISSATLDQPDKRQFGEQWYPDSFDPGIPDILPPTINPEFHFPFKPSASITLGNLQRIYKRIDEDSRFLSADLKMPFQVEDGDGYVQFGVFGDRVERTYDQDSYSNFSDTGAKYFAPWEDFWSAAWESQTHIVSGANTDVDYDGEQNIEAFYAMVELPLLPNDGLSVVGGARIESTEISVQNHPESGATWFPPGSVGPVQLIPGAGDVSIEQTDVLPALGLEWRPFDKWTFRASWSRTIARQTFKELTPILQQEFLGGPIFIGDPGLRTSDVTNWDLRAEYVPYKGGLASVSFFRKDITDAIEYVQRLIAFTFTTPTNYPSGRLQGVELEWRQDLGRLVDELDGLSFGMNATFIDSVVKLPPDEVADFLKPEIQAPITERDMTAAPEHLYNLYLTYDLPDTGTQLGLFYTVQGDTLLAGPGESKGNFIPSIYAAEYDTLNFSVSQKLGEHFKLQIQAKNLTNPDIETVYRSQYIGADVTKTSSSKGIDFSIALSASFAL
ncbi:MAG: TonB-dependent receptor [Planctomycetota bacterium]